MVDWKAPVKALLVHFGWELKPCPDIHFIRHHRVDLVIDVGANEGQYGASLRQRGYRGAIRSFEPASQPFAALTRNSLRDHLWEVRHTAAGAQNGEAEINISEASVFNSFKPLSDKGRTEHPMIGVIGTEIVPVSRLDDLVPDHGNHRLFLKIDTQGFEREVLEGASAILERAEGLMLELPVEHLYSGVWSLDEALRCLADRGYVPAQFRQVIPLPGDPASAYEFDCIFRRRQAVHGNAPAG